jgi:hypothetical protein
MKKVLSITLALLMFLAPLTVHASSAEEVPVICQGIFEYLQTPEGYDPFLHYIHFYPNGVFYASQLNGSSFAAGFYEIKDEPLEITDAEIAEKTISGSQTIYLTLTDGSEYETLAYDAENGKVGLVKHSYNNVLTQNKESAHTSEDEFGVAMTEYVLGDDEYSLIRFMHNGTFENTVGALLEGTWDKDGSVYTMNDTDGGTSTLTANEDDTAIYVDPEGESHSLNLIKAAEAVLSFRGSVAATYGDMIVTIDCFEGDKAVMTMTYGGRDTLSNGTWKMAADYSHIALVLNDEEYTAPLKMPDQTFDFEMVTSDGAVDVTIPLTTAEEATLLYTFKGENTAALNMECYSNGTCAVIYTGMGTVTDGTWAMDTSSQMPKWTVELAETFENQGVTVEADGSGFFFTFKNATGQLEEKLILSYADMQ